METNHRWNGSVQDIVRRGCDAVLHTVKEYEEQQPVVAIPMVGNGDASINQPQKETDSSASLPWMKRFTSKTSTENPTATSALISQLNKYHRHDPIGSNWRSKNKVTPPSGALKSPWDDQVQQKLSTQSSTRKHPGDPPPLLLAGSSASILANTVSRTSMRNSHDVKQAISLPMKKGVPHVYHDYSNVPDVVGVVRKKTGGVTQPFPEKLHTMLDNDDDPSIVSWLSHGRAFLVRKPATFTEQIMPKYFRQTKLTSFQRQLNLYGFRRLTQGADSGAYYHELFLRGRPQLCLRMQRQKIKGTGHKQPADVQTEPNFYNMAPSKSCVESKRSVQVPAPAPPPASASPPPSVVHSSPRTTTCNSATIATLSPGSRGAANLLQGMRSIKGRSFLDSKFSLGQPAMSSTISLNESHRQQSIRTLSPTSSLSTIQSSQIGNSPTVSSNSDLYVTKQRSLSLLGRVQNFPKHLKMRTTSSGIIDSSSAFFWPPRKATIGSPSHTAATFESSVASSLSPPHPYI